MLASTSNDAFRPDGGPALVQGPIRDAGFTRGVTRP